MMRPRVRCSGAPNGFTLIELLVVFSLLALLLSIAVPRYHTSAAAAREAVRSRNLATLREALDQYRADQGRYPEKLVDLVHKQYLRALPVDPVTDSHDWKVLAKPGGTEAGVYDVAPPSSNPEQAAAQ